MGILRSRGREITVVLPLFVLVGILVGALALTFTRPDRPPASAQPVDAGGTASDFVPFAPLSNAEPCSNAADVTTAQLEDQSDVPVVLPDEAQAGVDVAGGAFCDNNQSAPVLTVELESSRVGARSETKAGDPDVMWAFYEDEYPQEGRTEWLDELAADWGGTVRDINGAPAWIAPQGEPGARSEVILTVPGSDRIIRVQAPADVPVSELVDLAESFPSQN